VTSSTGARQFTLARYLDDKSHRQPSRLPITSACLAPHPRRRALAARPMAGVVSRGLAWPAGRIVGARDDLAPQIGEGGCARRSSTNHFRDRDRSPARPRAIGFQLVSLLAGIAERAGVARGNELAILADQLGQAVPDCARPVGQRKLVEIASLPTDVAEIDTARLPARSGLVRAGWTDFP